MPDRWEKIKHLYEFAVGVHPSERKGSVQQASLLQAGNEAGDLLRQPAVKPAASLRDGDMVADRYRVIRLLGRGGMGEVYEVEDESLQERVALKTVCAERASRKDFIRRFKREIQLARKVTHPNVCRVFDVGEAKPKSPGMEAVHFFTMELLRGETLWARIQRLKMLTREQAFAIAVQLADGLRAAHEAGVVHTDFKSGNVILCTAPRGERAVITDFGLAHFDPDTVIADNVETVSAALQFAGTPDYMSPEQMTGGTVTAASDIYSFGVVLYEMASGKLPFDRRNPSLGAVQRMAERYPAIPYLDQRWSGAISRCLRAEPAKRIQTAAAVRLANRAIQIVLDRIAALPFRDSVNVVVLSDHGMADG